MYRCRFEGTEKINAFEELINVFLPRGEYEILRDDSRADNCVDSDTGRADNGVRVFRFDGDKDRLKRELYDDLSAYTGKRPKWGILTGIRPVKLTGELYDASGDMDAVSRLLGERYLLSEEKTELITGILEYQRRIAGRPEDDSISVYVGIPFCPTRCLYCSFTSNQVDEDETERYLEALYREIEYCGQKVKERGYRVESLYIGGGTPTSLTADRLETLLKKINDSFDLSGVKEFTVEAGRPDTFTEEKLRVIKDAGADRISINPQTMKDETLELIGRRHTVAETERAFELTRAAGIGCINTDLIAGLPGENEDDFRHSVDRITELGAENITLHTLAVKRASRLREMDSLYNYRNEELRERMLSYALKALGERGYRPYYLYRQKHTSGNTENIGFCKNDTVSVYNIRIMEEAQSVLAMGAGGISKVYFHAENRLERVANVSNYEIYIDRIDEMIQRKEDSFWR